MPFDVVLPRGIPYKGQVLNQIASKFLDATADIVPNWKIDSPDPNVTVGKTVNYSPQVAVKTRTIEIGDYTSQHFSGQCSHRERAGALKRKNDLLIAVIRALKECNNCEIVKSDLTAKKIFGYILSDK